MAFIITLNEGVRSMLDNKNGSSRVDGVCALETWSEAYKKGMTHLTECAINASRTQHRISIQNGSEIPIPEVIDFIASEIANDVFSDDDKNKEADLLYNRMVEILNLQIERIMQSEYQSKALELDYEKYHDYILELVEAKLRDGKTMLKDATEEIVGTVFDDLRANPDALKKLMEGTKDFFEVPFSDDQVLEAHMIDSIAETISENEKYMAKKTGTYPDQRKI